MQKINILLSGLVAIGLVGCSNVQSEYEKQRTVIKQQKKIIDELTDTNSFLKKQNVELSKNLETSQVSNVHNQKINNLNSMYEQKLQEMLRSLNSLNSALPADGQITIRKVDGGDAIRLPNMILFSSGSANLSSKGLSVMKQIASILAKYSDRNIRVDGHTDTDKIRKSKFSSNWDLGAKRAVSIVEYLTKNTKIDPSRFHVASYSMYRPVNPNKKSVNRRVEIVILDN